MRGRNKLASGAGPAHLFFFSFFFLKKKNPPRNLNLDLDLILLIFIILYLILFLFPSVLCSDARLETWTRDARDQTGDLSRKALGAMLPFPAFLCCPTLLVSRFPFPVARCPFFVFVLPSLLCRFDHARPSLFLICTYSLPRYSLFAICYLLFIICYLLFVFCLSFHRRKRNRNRNRLNTHTPPPPSLSHLPVFSLLVCPPVFSLLAARLPTRLPASLGAPKRGRGTGNTTVSFSRAIASCGKVNIRPFERRERV